VRSLEEIARDPQAGDRVALVTGHVTYKVISGPSPEESFKQRGRELCVERVRLGSLPMTMIMDRLTWADLVLYWGVSAGS
jgi:hypothetical protein